MEPISVENLVKILDKKRRVRIFPEKAFNPLNSRHMLEDYLIIGGFTYHFGGENESGNDLDLDLTRQKIIYPLKKHLTLKKFVEEYVDTSLKLAKNKMPLESFDGSLRKEISKKLKIHQDEVLYLHHSFHWSFFLSKNNSPFELYDSGGKKGIIYVQLNRDSFEEDWSNLTEYILENYKDYLLKRSNQFFSVNILAQ